MEGPDKTDPPEGMSKNVTRSRSSCVGGEITVEAARVGILRLVRTPGAIAVCKHPRNRKGGRNAFDRTFLAALVSMNHPYVSGERPVSNASGRGEDQGPIAVDAIQNRTRRLT